MAQRNLIPLSTESLSFNGKDKTMCGEASSLGFKLEQLYDDACDVGLALRSHKTNEISRWYLEETLVDARENELQGWILRPTHETLRMHPQLKDFKLTVFND